MKHRKYQQQLGATEAYTKRIMEAKKGDRSEGYKRGYDGCFIFDSWSSSNKSEEYAMEVCAELFGILKKNTK